MSKPNPTVEQFMTTSPHTISVKQTMAAAHQMMRTHHVRHLPVLGPEGLVGIVSDGDLHLVETLRDVDPAKVQVEDAMSQDVYAVSPTTPIDEVVTVMAERKLGSTIVSTNGKVVGIFTTVDACRAFADLLRRLGEVGR
jgi:acetoin utilization protein AcuB